jgi:uncharacterized protein YndB with AHSA1/START domain
MATYTAAITIQSPVQKVFDVLTKPELVRLWQYGRVLTTDWTIGGNIRFSAAWDGKVLEQWGTVLEVRTNELIKYNLFTPRPGLEDNIGNYCVTSYVLTNGTDTTNIEIIQEDNRPNAFVPTTLQGILVALKEVAENNGGVL